MAFNAADEYNRKTYRLANLLLNGLNLIICTFKSKRHHYSLRWRQS